MIDGTETHSGTPAPDTSAIGSAQAVHSRRSSVTAPTTASIKHFHRRRKFAILILVALIALIAGGAYLYFNSNGNKPETAKSSKSGLAPVVTVTTVLSMVRPMENVLTVTGTVNPWDELNIGSETAGLRIDSVNFEEGDEVRKGKVLVKLNSALLEAQLSEQESKLKSDRASLRKAVQPNRPEDLLVLKSALEKAEEAVTQTEAQKRKAEVALENAETNVDRFKLLVSEGAKSGQELEDKVMAEKQAQLELFTAEHKVEEARRDADKERQKLVLGRKGGSNEDVTISTSSVEQTEAKIKHLNAQIKQTIICAPDDGLIVKRNAHIGDICEGSKPLLTMIRLNRLELKAQANATDLTKFKAGQSVTVSTSGATPLHVTGKVRLVSPLIDPSSRLGVVHIDLPENCGLTSGMFVRGEILLSNAPVLTVPVDSVVSRGGESFVFTLDGNRAVSTPIKTGAESDKYVEIASGLKVGQSVVAKGARFLSDRDVVDLAK